MSLLRRTTTTASPTVEPLEHAPRPAGLSPVGLAELRDQVDPDPLVEQATDRLRTALASLDARDEWGRQLAWRQIARIAIGPLLTELRDAQTAARLTEACSNGWPTRPTM